MPFIDLLAQQGAQAAGNILGAGMGLALQGVNNRQQLKQQQRLTDMQIAAQKQMGIFNREQQMQLWNDTNYSAQKEQMKKAGLSPGLMYGTSGGGGITASAAPGSVSAPQARQTNESLGMGLQMGQSALIQAQIEAIKAQKRNTDADTANKIAENPNIPSTGENIKADTALKGAQKSLVETQQGIASIEEAVQAATQNAHIATILQGTDASMEQLRMLRNSRHIQDETVQTQIKQIKADLAATIIHNSLMQAEKIKTERSTLGQGQQVRLTEEQIKAVWNSVQQGWDNMSIERIKQIMNQEQMNYENEIPKGVQEILDRIYVIPGLSKGQNTSIPGFHSWQKKK